MDADNKKAVGNQKVFITLQAVLGVQDALRVKERTLEQYYRESQTAQTTEERERKAGLSRQTCLQYDAMIQVVEALNLPINADPGTRVINRVRQSLPVNPA